MRHIRPILLLLFMSLNMATLVFAHSVDLNKQEQSSLENIIEDLTQVQTVFIGEIHDQPAHHQAQLQLIKELHQAGAAISVGLEMFRQDGQAVLDKWVQGQIDEAEFSRIFLQHWSTWDLYRDIFVFARDNKIPLVGLNIPREIVSQVARNGFSSLSKQQRKKLPIATCNVSPEYQAFIRRALGGHSDNLTVFENFCEAQMLWDVSMAKTLDDYLKIYPQRIVVVLAGNGHSWKHGIPEQLARLGDYSYRVLLPEVHGRIDLRTIGSADADYLLQGVEQAPIH